MAATRREEKFVKRSTSGDKKALYRAKKAISNVNPVMFNKLMEYFLELNECGMNKSKSPSALKIKQNVKKELSHLNKKRSKSSLAKRKLLLDRVVGSAPSQEVGSYKRKSEFESTVKLKQFIDDVSVPLPGKKTVNSSLIQKKILPKSVKHLEREFRSNHPNNKVSRATFYRHIPSNVLTSSKHKHRSCLCEVCTAVDLKLDVLNKHLNTPFEGRDSIAEMSLCCEVTLDCLHRNCDSCGMSVIEQIIHNQISETDMKQMVKWRNWERVSQIHKAPEPVEKHTSLQEMTDILLKDLATFPLHLFTFRWQYRQYKECKSTIPSRPSMGLAIMDFSENFTCRHQDEVQSGFYGTSPITVHPTVTYYVCEHCQEIVTEYIVFISGDTNHDAAMAQTILNRTIAHMKTRCQLKDLIVFSDGCGSQYKSRLPFHLLTKMSDEVKVSRAYFGSRHGKSPCDACGGVIKKAVDADIKSRSVVITNAQQMFHHCDKNYTLPYITPADGKCVHTRRNFVLLKSEEIDRSVTSDLLSTVKDTRKFHSVRKVDVNILEVRALSCFCLPCLEETGSCVNAQYVKPWKRKEIKMAVNSVCGKESETHTSTNVGDDASKVIVDGTDSGANEDGINDKVLVVPLEREDYFQLMQERFASCTSFEELQQQVAFFSVSLDHFPLPAYKPRSLFDVGSCDSSALTYIPEHCETLYPVLTEADGNCIPRTFSLLIFGSQDMHVEIRCRIVVELVNMSNYYLQLEQSELDLLCQLSSCYGVDPKAVFENETLQVSKLHIFMGMWQIMAAANAFDVQVRSVYPFMASDRNLYEIFHDRLIKPRLSEQTQICYILWTSTRDDVPREHWAANHVVPLILMPLTAVSSSKET